MYTNGNGSINVSDVKWADSVNGDDSNAGTEVAPFKAQNNIIFYFILKLQLQIFTNWLQTLTKAVQSVVNGGTVSTMFYLFTISLLSLTKVYLKEGVYSSNSLRGGGDENLYWTTISGTIRVYWAEYYLDSLKLN